MATKECSRSPAVEDYAKAIFSLQSRSDEPVSTNALAERLGITPGSVSAMLKKLDELGLTTHVPYRGVRLTADGRRLALEVIRHHRLLESFLADALGMPWDRVHAEAEVLEHVLSEDLERADRGQARTTRRWTPTATRSPAPTSSSRSAATRSMESLRPATQGVFVRVSDSDPEMLRYLAGCGISPGDRFAVRERQPFGGPLFVLFGEQEHAIGGQLAGAMRVEVDEAPGEPGGADREQVDGRD